MFSAVGNTAADEVHDMHSIRTKITAVATGAIIITMIIAAAFGVTAIRDIGIKSSEQMLLLLCGAGQKNLNTYLEDVEQEVKTITAFVESDLDGVSKLDDKELQEHIDRVHDFFNKVVYKTNGIMSYYYRTDPNVSSDVKGFWLVNPDGEGFREHEVTDITQYDTDDTSKLVWFTVPKTTGESVWLPPYITENLNERVISYNTPIYYNDQFVGVVGIEMDYSFMDAMEYGMQPAGGIGVGIDRLCMFFCEEPTIREVLLFPTMKDEK